MQEFIHSCINKCLFAHQYCKVLQKVQVKIVESQTIIVINWINSALLLTLHDAGHSNASFVCDDLLTVD